MNVEKTSGAPPPAPKRGDNVRARPKPATDHAARSRESEERAVRSIEKAGATNAQILKELGQKAVEFPPEKDLVKIGVAAANYSLTSLESARVIAEQIRAEIELGREEAASAAAREPESGDRERIASALIG